MAATVKVRCERHRNLQIVGICRFRNGEALVSPKDADRLVELDYGITIVNDGSSSEQTASSKPEPADLRERAEALGIDVPRRASARRIAELIEQHETAVAALRERARALGARLSDDSDLAAIDEALGALADERRVAVPGDAATDEVAALLERHRTEQQQ